MFRRWWCFLFIGALLGPGVGRAHAQSETKGEKELREDTTATRNRQAEAAQAQKNQDDIAAQGQQRLADAAALKRIRDSAPQREEAAREREKAERDQAVANEAAYQVQWRQSMAEAHVRDKGRAMADLARNPPPVAAPGTYTECDSLVAAQYDDTRPIGLNGIVGTDVDAPAAVAACREQLAKDPASARTKFELARALVLAKRCDEAVPALRDAIAAGSSAAQELYANLAIPTYACHGAMPPDADYLTEFRRALAMGSADAGWALYQNLLPPWNKLPDGSEEKKAMSNEMDQTIDKVHTLIAKRVAAEDTFALFLQAWIADMTGSKYYGLDSIYVRYRCVVRAYDLCKQFDEVH